MKLQLVSYEQAKALEELELPHLDHEGFCYRKDGTLTQPIYTGEWCNTFAPSLELVAKWLRDCKNLSITISWMPNIKKYNCICSDMNYTPKEHFSKESYKMYKECFEVRKNENCWFDSYEEALSAGIDKSIEILKNNKTMNKEEAKHLSSVLKAYSEGAEIEHLLTNGLWATVCDDPTFSEGPMHYRVKGVSGKTRIYENIVEFLDAMKLHGPFLLHKVMRQYHMPLAVSNRTNNIETTNGFYTFKLLDDEYVWQDGTPCNININ